MKVTLFPFSLKLKYPFGISGNTRTETPVVFVKIEEKDIIAFGEASLPPYLGINQLQVMEVFKSFDFSKFNLQLDEEKLLEHFSNHAKNCMPAIAALDIALNDWKGKFHHKSVWELYGINPLLMSYNAMTIGIDSAKVIEKKVKEASEFNLLKVKIGSENDQELINTIRKYSDKPIIADANQGLKSKQSALELCKWLFDKNCLLIEQPLNKTDLNSHAWLSEYSPIPVIADESFQNENDLSDIGNYFSGINIKLMKCGGLTRGHRIAIEAKRKGLKVLMGCMNESSCANFAAAQIAPLADWVDLDGPFLINNNPFEDFKMKDGKIILNTLPGLGLTQKESESLFD